MSTGWKPPEGGFASRCDYWSDQWFVSVGAREAVIILPGGCGGT